MVLIMAGGSSTNLVAVTICIGAGLEVGHEDRRKPVLALNGASSRLTSCPYRFGGDNINGDNIV